jgi:hypothetical protein
MRKVLMLTVFSLIVLTLESSVGIGYASQFPTIQPSGKNMIIQYHWTLKDPGLGNANDVQVSHYANGVWLDPKEHDYGSYRIGTNQDGCAEGWRCPHVIVHYMTIPTDAKPKASALYIRFDYDTVLNKFEELVYMPDGKKITERGNFKIVNQ